MQKAMLHQYNLCIFLDYLNGTNDTSQNETIKVLKMAET